MKDINLMSLDMEYNQPSRSIIQIGLVVGNLQSGEILESYCEHVYTKEIISDFIIGLTGIKQEDVDQGRHLGDIYSNIVMLHTKYECFRNPLTWGGGDAEDLRHALGLDDERYVFGRRWIDAKTLFISRCLARDEKTQSGLAKSLTRLGMQFEGRKHNARDDAINTFRIYRALLLESNNV